MINALTIDVEEYFHPTEVQRYVDPSGWALLPSRIDSQVEDILDLLDRHHTRATFFVLGWIAEHRPSVVYRICSRGHEIACHSYAHQLVYSLTPNQFLQDTMRAVKAIEDACGVTPRAYRAPSYSITTDSLWALEILAQCGFEIDSSIYPINHDRYGIPGFSRHPVNLETPSGLILEIPVATVRLGGGSIAPIGGGAYLRLLPYCYMSAGIRRVNKEESTAVCIYFHPWEIDPGQPKLTAGFVSQLRTYAGLGAMYRKIDRLVSEFEFGTLSAAYGVKSDGQTSRPTQCLHPKAYAQS